MSALPSAGRPMWLKSFAVQVMESFPTVRGLRRAIREAVGESSALEIGCGLGVNAAHVQGHYVGIDVNERVIDEARALRPGTRFQAGDVHKFVDTLTGTPVVFLSLVLHELSTAEREDVLRATARIAGEQVFVFDFDPLMPAAAKWRLALMEKSTLASYWRFDLTAFMAAEGWAGCERRAINRRFCQWKFTRSVGAD